MSHKANLLQSQPSYPTLGYMVGTIRYEHASILWSGVVDAAQKLGANLLCFVGNELNAPYDFNQYSNVLYDLAGAANVDGLIIFGSLKTYVSDAEWRAFINRYRALPIISIAFKLPGIPSVDLEYNQGMQKMMTHLIQVHGCRKIGFIRGPKGQWRAEARYRAYRAALETHGLPFDESLVTPPHDWTPYTSQASVKLLLDERKKRPGTDIDAIVAITDEMAIWTMENLEARDIHVPQDLIVVGIGDVEIARFVTPPLSTVQERTYEQGWRAVEMLLALLRGEAVSDEIIASSDIVIRQSCGCIDPEVSWAVSHSGTPTCNVEDPHLIARSKLNQSLSDLLTELDTPHAKTRATRLWEALWRELRGIEGGIFLILLNQYIRESAATEEDLSAWQHILSTLRRYALPHLQDMETRTRAEDLWHQARIAVGEMTQRSQAHRRLQAIQRAWTLHEIGRALITRFEITELADVVARELPRLDIPGCYIALYEDREAPDKWARLILAYHAKGRIDLNAETGPFPSQELIPTSLRPPTGPYTLVLQSLHFQSEHLGYVLFQVGTRDAMVYEVLRRQLSSAIKGALLYHETLASRQAAEKADRLKTRLLANVTHELRTPLHTILDFTQLALQSPTDHSAELSQNLHGHLQHIYDSAEHQLRIINDLLDLSRAEIDALDLYPELLDPRELLEQAFHSIADAGGSQAVGWRLELPEHLPVIQADKARLRQVLLNLLSNARKFTESGHITLGAEVAPPHLHIWVQDTGLGIPPDLQERIFEPFVTAEKAPRRFEGVGLGLSITRRLVALHNGTLKLESQPGQGSIFHIHLPLPSLGEPVHQHQKPTSPTLVLISAQSQPIAEIANIAQQRELEIRYLRNNDDVEHLLAEALPMALAWDMSSTAPEDWLWVQRLRKHPHWANVPLIVYGEVPAAQPAASSGLTSLMMKPNTPETLIEALNTLCPFETTGTILIVDDEEQARVRHSAIVAECFPDYVIQTASGGREAIDVMEATLPSLVILDLTMPDVDGFDVLDWMRADPATSHVPVLVLSGRTITLSDVQRLEQHAEVTIQTKDMLSTDEVVAALHKSLFGHDTLPTHTSALVKRAVAYFQQNYEQPLSRTEVANAIGVNERYLSRIFRQELTISPWDYLNRYRIRRAKILLRQTDRSITTIALEVGFNDSAYFSRVFHKLEGISPSAYREQAVN